MIIYILVHNNTHTRVRVRVRVRVTTQFKLQLGTALNSLQLKYFLYHNESSQQQFVMVWTTQNHPSHNNFITLWYLYLWLVFGSASRDVKQWWVCVHMLHVCADTCVNFSFGVYTLSLINRYYNNTHTHTHTHVYTNIWTLCNTSHRSCNTLTGVHEMHSWIALQTSTCNY